MLKRWLPWVVKLGLSGASIWFLARKVDFATVWVELKEVDPVMLAVALVVLLGQVAICAVRWKVVIRAIGAELPLRATAEIFWIGNFFNLALPGAVGGDAVRMWKSRRCGLSLSAAVNSVMLERVATLFALIVLVAATQPLLMGRVSDSSGMWVFPALTVMGVAGIGVLMVLDRLPEALLRWRLVRALAQLAADTRKLFLHPRHAAVTMGWAIFGHVNLSLTFYALAVGLGIQVTALDCVVLVPPVILFITLPISIAGWGARELAMVTLFGLVGVSSAQATALSILFGLLNIVAGLPGGVFWLASKDRPTAGEVEA